MKPDPTPEMVGLIHIPESFEEEFAPEVGEIISVGPGLPGTPDDVSDLNPGTRVIFAKQNGRPLEHDGEDFLVFKAENIMAVVD